MKKEIICLCNGVSKDDIEAALLRGCKRVSDVSAATRAGLGACGGSCKPYLERMLQHHLKTGTFLSEVRPKRVVKKSLQKKIQGEAE